MNLSDLRTRQRLLEAAAALLARDGLTPDLLARAASTAACPAERARVFFRRDEDVILALYARFAFDLEGRVPELPAGTVAERFRAAMAAKFEILAPYRDALAVLLASLLDPRNDLAALGPQTEIVRDRVRGVMAAVVEGASDRPAARREPLIRALYGAHLALVLLWCQDRTPGSPAAAAALAIAGDVLAFAAPLMGMPEAAPMAQRLDGLFRSLLDPADDPSIDERAEAILRRLLAHRRLLPGSSCADGPCPQCFALHRPRVKHFLRAGRPLHLIVPGFPAKTPSRRKALGPLPDMAEERALLFLDGVCRELAGLHPPGARLTVCSDGHAFADLVGVSDADVTRYGEEVRAMIARLGLASLDTFGMADLYEGTDFAATRERLTADYAPPLERVVDRAHRFEHAKAQFNGVHRFLFEELSDVRTDVSRTRLRKECHDLAYRVIQRSDGWGRLLADCFPAAVRLSIHPQPPHAEKIGILLGPAEDVWLTPWHGVALKAGEAWRFVKRAEAEELGATLVERDGRPSHFEIQPSSLATTSDERAGTIAK